MINKNSTRVLLVFSTYLYKRSTRYHIWLGTLILSMYFPCQSGNMCRVSKCCVSMSCPWQDCSHVVLLMLTPPRVSLLTPTAVHQWQPSSSDVRRPVQGKSWHDTSCYNIEDSLSLWVLNTLRFIYGRWDHLDESFIIQSKTNAHNHRFLRYKQFSIWWLLIGWSLGGFLRCWGLPSIIGKVFLRAFQYSLDCWKKPIIHGDTSEWSLWQDL